MTFRQYNACIAGWNAVHRESAKPEAPTPEEFDEMKIAMGDA